LLNFGIIIPKLKSGLYLYSPLLLFDMARPKNFDEEKVLEKAVELFWCKGYHGTSIGDVVEHLCINRASLYDTYGDKHTLYVKALEHFRETQAKVMIRMVEESDSAKNTLYGIFKKAVDNILADNSQKGCFMANSTLELANQDAAVAKIVSDNRKDIEHAFFKAIEKGQRNGEISGKHPAQALASFLFNTYNGLQVVGKTQPDRKELNDIIEVAFSVL
jgi:TetR/AcrR family transcriptional repressor of nem operon